MSEAQGIQARLAALKAELDGAIAHLKMDDDTAAELTRLEKEARRIADEAADALNSVSIVIGTLRVTPLLVLKVTGSLGIALMFAIEAKRNVSEATQSTAHSTSKRSKVRRSATVSSIASSAWSSLLLMLQLAPD